MKLTIDFETRSEADLRVVGAWMYSRHPSTEVMCLGWDTGQWVHGQDPPEDLFTDIHFMAETVEAHNAFFEYCIWLNVCHKRYGWPAIPDHMWRCSAAKAAACSIPRDLGSAGRVMGVGIVKDEEFGKWAMMKLSKPRKPTKNDPSTWLPMAGDDWEKMLTYNTNDVASEVALSDALPDLSPKELEVWRTSERMNRRGIMLDVVGCEKAVALAGEHARNLTSEFKSITGIDSAGQRAKFITWLAQYGTLLPDTQAGTLDDLLAAGTLKPFAHRAVYIMRELGMSSIKKYRTALEMADTDGRVRGTIMYHGAGTGRWTGKGLQPHNYPRHCPPDMNKAWEDIHDMSLGMLGMTHGDPIKFLSYALRGSIVAPPGKILMWGDYAQIEARMVFWLARDKRALDVFRDPMRDMYCEMASDIFNRVITKANEDERFLGKQATLALGFGAGFVKFLVHCRNLGAPPLDYKLVPAGERDTIYRWIQSDGMDQVRRLISNPTRDDLRELILAKYIVNRYRSRYDRSVVALWRAVEHAARGAMQMPGIVNHITGFQRVAYQYKDNFLNCQLPSGRIIRYRDPKIAGKDMTYMSVDNGKWVRTKTYGGKLVENIVQASARDVMAEAMLRLEKQPEFRELVLTVHDELGSEVDPNANAAEFECVMAVAPAWCADLPIRVEVQSGKRYKK